MKRLVQTLAVGAALVAVGVGVWRDYGAVLTLQRAAIAYLAAYFLGGVFYLAAGAALRHARDPLPPIAADEADTRRGPPWLRQRATEPAGGPTSGREVRAQPAGAPADAP